MNNQVKINEVDLDVEGVRPQLGGVEDGGVTQGQDFQLKKSWQVVNE